MNYWGKPASVQDLSRLVRDPRVGGIYSTDVPVLARQKGLTATFVEGSVGRIRSALERAVPPILMVAAGGGSFHFFVVSGYNDRERRIACEDYDGGKVLLGYDELEDAWEPAGRFMLEIEVSKSADFRKQAMDLEAAGLYGEAAELYRKALELDPEHFEARTGLGNCLLALGKLEEAAAEYRKAHAANASDPRVMNNLANALIELKRDTAEAERLAEGATAAFEETWKRAAEEARRETEPSLRALKSRDLPRLERDLAHALGTLGQARAANGRHELAVAAWKASYDHLPLTAADFRAKRLYEIGLSCRALKMPAEGRAHLERALAQAADPALRAKIEAALREQ
jgi:tetratricopeptide (TPR) repeat protein